MYIKIIIADVLVQTAVLSYILLSCSNDKSTFATNICNRTSSEEISLYSVHDFLKQN